MNFEIFGKCIQQYIGDNQFLNTALVNKDFYHHVASNSNRKTFHYIHAIKQDNLDYYLFCMHNAKSIAELPTMYHFNSLGRYNSVHIFQWMLVNAGIKDIQYKDSFMDATRILQQLATKHHNDEILKVVHEFADTLIDDEYSR
jgi:hypothetical protein